MPVSLPTIVTKRSEMLDKFVSRLLRHAQDLSMILIEKTPEFIHKTFAPSQVLEAILRITTLQLFIMGWGTAHRFLVWCWQNMTTQGRTILDLNRKMHLAATYKEWVRLAETLDKVKGLDQWRKRDFSPLLSVTGIRKYVNDIENLMKKGSVFDLMFRLRGGMSREGFGVMNQSLYTVASAGTKKIIEHYHRTISNGLEFICDEEVADVPDEAKLAFFNEVRHAYGRTGLALSGGAYLGYYQAGVVKALFRQNLLPRVISGASAGSLLAAVIGCKNDKELDVLLNSKPGAPGGYQTNFFKFKTNINHPMGRSIQQAVPKSLRWLFDPILLFLFDWKVVSLDIKNLQEVCIRNCGRMTFQEAFDHTGRIINITVSPTNSYDPPRLLNYLTSPHVCVWSAACASCAIPGIFDPAELWCKEPSGEYCPESIAEERRSSLSPGDVSPTRSRTTSENVSTHGALLASNDGGSITERLKKPRQIVAYTDGSIEADLPMQQLSELFNVNHFIVSQVNPHSALFSTLSLRGSGGMFNEKSFMLRALIGYTHFLKEEVKSWIKNVADFMITFVKNIPHWALKRGFYQTLTQKYEGRENDITIMPWSNHISVFTAWCSIIHNPTEDEYNSMVRASERATWAAMSRIKSQCFVEKTLERSVQKLRRRIAESCLADEAPPSQGPELDRVPSYYTSRSIINNGGLSISDPKPKVSFEDCLDFEPGEEDGELDEEDGESRDYLRNSHEPLTKTTSMANFYYKNASPDKASK